MREFDVPVSNRTQGGLLSESKPLPVKTYPMGECYGPYHRRFMKTQPGYEEWADAEAMWGSVERAIVKDVANETTR